MTIASATLGRGQLTIVGNGFPSDSSASSAFLYGESCSELEFCNCQSCSASVSCPSGSLCLTKSSGSSSVSYCFPQCAALGDDSCACGYVCSVVFGEGSETIAMCLPEGYAQSFGSYHSQCTAHVGRATCSAPRAYQEQYQAAETVVSAVMDNSGDVRAIGSSSDVAAGFCATNADCFDGNVCTTDSCDTSTRLCQYASVVGCDSMQPAVTRRTTPYMYYSYYTAGSETAATQTSSVSYLNAVGTRSFATDKDDHPLQKIDLPFSFVYFGNLVSTGYVSPNGVLALPPAMECVNDQVWLFLLN